MRSSVPMPTPQATNIEAFCTIETDKIQYTKGGITEKSVSYLPKKCPPRDSNHAMIALGQFTLTFGRRYINSSKRFLNGRQLDTDNSSSRHRQMTVVAEGEQMLRCFNGNHE